MGKKLISLALLLGLAVFLWGCGDDDEELPPAAPLAWKTPASFSGMLSGNIAGLPCAGTITGMVTGTTPTAGPPVPCPAPGCPTLMWCATINLACGFGTVDVNGWISVTTGAMYGDDVLDWGTSGTGNVKLQGTATLTADGFIASGTWTVTAPAGSGTWTVTGRF